MGSLVFVDRLQDYFTTIGTGALTVQNSPQTGFVSTSTIGDGNSSYFLAFTADFSTWEIWKGTYTNVTQRLSRDTVLASSNGGSAVNWPAGTKTLQCDLPASLLATIVATVSSLPLVATSGSYNDLSDKPALGALAHLSSVNNSNWSGAALSIANGGTGQASASAAFNALSPLTTQGDILYAGSGGINARLPIGSNGQVLAVAGGLPGWATAPSTPPSGSSGQLQYNNSGAFGGATGLAYGASGTNLTITAQHITDTALSVQPCSTAQTAPIARIGGLQFMLHYTNFGTAVNETHLYFPTGHVSGAPYVLGTNTTTFGGAQPTDNDATAFWGFNWIGTGQVVADGTSTPSARRQYMMLEHDWWMTPGDSTSRVDEWHYDVSDDTSTAYRLFHSSWSPVSRANYFGFVGSVEVFALGELGTGYYSKLTKNTLTFPHSSAIYFTQSDNVTTFAALQDSSATIGGVSKNLVQPGGVFDLRLFPAVIDAGLNNGSTRPAAASALISGEIWGHSSGSYTNEDGFLRLSAGGGTTASYKTYIDISGFSAVSDMNGTITFFPAANLGFQVGPSGAFKHAYNSSAYISGNVNSSAQLSLAPSADSTGAFNFTNAATSQSILNLDSTNGRVGIRNTSPSATFHVTTPNMAANSAVGFQIDANITPTASTTMYGAQFNLAHGSGGTANGTVIATQYNVNITGANNPTSAIALETAVNNTSGHTTATAICFETGPAVYQASSVVSTLTHVHIRDVYTNGGQGVVGTQYGLKIESLAGGGTNYAIYTGAGTVLFGDLVKFAGTNTTGSGSAALGSNCPAVTATAPYTWIKALSSDGSSVYIPVWK